MIIGTSEKFPRTLLPRCGEIVCVPVSQRPRATESDVAFEVSIARGAPRAPMNSQREDVVQLSEQ